MEDLLRHVVLSVGDTRYDWIDVLLSAVLRDEWSDLEREVRAGLACLAAAEDDEDDGADPDEVEAAATGFRYARDLVTAEETEAWLAARHLTVDEWSGYIERSVLRQARVEELDELIGAHPATGEAVSGLLWVEGVCSGRLAQLAHALGARAAVHARLAAAGTATAGPTDVEATVARLPRRIARRGLMGVPPDVCRERLPALATLEVLFQRFRGEVVTPRAVRDRLAIHRLDWVRVDCRYLAFADEQAAREALLSLREDGLGLGEVADAAKAEVREARLYLEQLDPAARGRFLAAGPGDVIGPVPLAEGIAAIVVDGKVLPTEEDPEARQRAEAAVLAGAVEREIGDRVRWHVPL